MTMTDTSVRSYEDALTAWRAVVAEEDRLRRSGDVQGVDRELAIADLAERRLAAARELRAARDAHRAVAAASANERAAAAVPAWEAASAEMKAARNDLEQAFASFVVRAWRFSRSRVLERQAGSAVVAALAPGAANDDQHANLSAGFQIGDLAVAFTEDGGVEWRDRPAAGLFGSDQPSNDPSSDVFWESLARLVRARPEQVLSTAGSHLRAALIEANNEGEVLHVEA